MTSARADLAVVDTSVYVENFRSGRFETELLTLPFLVRISAVVLAELGRGARSRPARRFVDHLARNSAAVAPTTGEWIRSGEVVRTLGERYGYDVQKLREIHFDVLIALSARRLGARVITCNAGDFRAIEQVVRFHLVVW